MGVRGLLSLGGMLGRHPLITGQVLILPLIGIIFVLEVASDIIQVSSYKLAVSACFEWRRSTPTSSWAAGTRRRSRCASGFVGALAGMLGVTLFVARSPKAEVSGDHGGSRRGTGPD